jgi:hypothetical protein
MKISGQWEDQTTRRLEDFLYHARVVRNSGGHEVDTAEWAFARQSLFALKDELRRLKTFSGHAAIDATMDYIKVCDEYVESNIEEPSVVAAVLRAAERHAQTLYDAARWGEMPKHADGNASPVGMKLIRATCMALPLGIRTRYFEEFRAELVSLDSRWAQICYAVHLLCAARRMRIAAQETVHAVK